MKIKLPKELKLSASVSDQMLIKEAVQLLVQFYKIDNYETVDFNFGQTKTLKKILKSDKGNFFIKVGEKVDKEKNAYQSHFVKNGQFFLSPLAIKQKSSRILFLPFFRGINLQSFIFDNAMHWDVVFRYLDKILGEVKKEFWLKNNVKNNIPIDQIVTEYINERVKVLNKVIFSSDKYNLSFNELIKLPVIYKINGRVTELPSIEEMISGILNNFKSFPAQSMGCISGDFQPSNILVDQNKNFKIIDLANFKESGDVAMDLGKFFNYFSRFYLVSLIRDNKKAPSHRAQVKITPSYLEILFEKPTDKVFTNLANIMEENFIRKLAIEMNDYFLPDRVKLYKFVINLITIRRHLMKEELANLLFVCLIDSYLEIQEKVIKI